MKKELLVLAFLFMVIPVVSAEIALEQPDSLYNFGDRLEMDVTVRAGGPTEGFLIVNIFCGSSDYEIFRSYISLDSGEEETKNVNFVFGNSLDLLDQDECYVRASFDFEEAESQRFQVSRRISMGVNTAKRIFEPGERINLDGTATKINGESVNGFVEVGVSPLNISLYSVVRDGEFRVNFSMPDDVSGAQKLHFFAYEEDRNNEITNQGNFDLEIFVRQTLDRIDVALSEDDLTPGDSLTISANLIDQAGTHMEGDLSIRILNPQGSVHLQDIISSGDDFIFESGSSFQAGYWKIEAEVGETLVEKLFYIEERNDLSFELANGTLFVTNIGNVPYVGPIEVLIGDENIVKQVEIGAGKTKTFKLTAPDGSYQIEIRNSGESFNLGSAPLTGRAIGIGEGRFEWPGSFLVWILMVLVLGMAILMVHYRKGLAKEIALLRGLRKNPNSNPESGVNGGSVITSGQKVEAGFLILNIDENREVLNSIIEKAKSYKAGVRYDGTHKVMLFAPHLTNEKDNSETVLRVAKEIEDIINIYNMKHPDQVNYGMGGSVGEIIAEKKDGRLRFVSIGKVMSATKRLSNEAKNEILISGELKEKIMGTGFKIVKSKIDDVWKVDKVMRERETHKKFIRDFVDKN